jgi:hypothetical protein
LATVKRLFTVVVLLMLLFNWIGYQLYNTITDQVAGQNATENTGQTDDLWEPGLTPYKIPDFHISTYPKVMDFDDLFQFASRPNYSDNEIVLNISNDLLADHANKEPQRVSFKCFNGEYYSRLDRLFANYPDAYSCGKLPDRYLLKIPVVFLSPKDHPPQYLG